MHRWAWGSGRRRTVKREERNKLQQAEGAGSDRGAEAREGSGLDPAAGEGVSELVL